MTLPNFLIIGAAKSGTTSLYRYLKQHPEIYMSPVKEPHFFSFDSESKWTNGPGDTIPKAITDIEQYKKLFSDVRNEKAIGEASTSYLYRSESAERIHDLIPDTKLIAILRQPAERAFSAYMHLVRDQRETATNFFEALQCEEQRKNQNWDPIWHYTSVGFYYEQLSRYYLLFNRQQIKIFLYEELKQDQTRVVQETFAFLGIHPQFSPDISVKFNVSGEQKSQFIYRITTLLFNSANPIRWISRRIIPEVWRAKVTNWIREQNIEKHQIPLDIKNQLTGLYRDDILKLQVLINRDLSHWLE